MGSYLVIIAVLIIFFCIRRRRRTAAVAWQILNQRKQNKENVVMKEHTLRLSFWRVKMGKNFSF